jgi:two-component system, NtrC family, nitrogen regulation sensor histidine kinase NtrY
MSISNHSSVPSSPPSPQEDAKRRHKRRRTRIIVLALATVPLFALLFVQAAFDTNKWFITSSVDETISLYVLSTINFLAFMVLLMALVRNIIKLRQEGLERKLGSRFKTRLVSFFVILSILPVTVLFVATTSWISRNMNKWFSQPVEEMRKEANYIESHYVEGEGDNLRHLAVTLARIAAQLPNEALPNTLAAEMETQQLQLAQLYSKDGRLITQRSKPELDKMSNNFRKTLGQVLFTAIQGVATDAEVLERVSSSNDPIYLIAAAPVSTERGGALVIARSVPPKFSQNVINLRKFQSDYNELKGEEKWFKNTAMLTLVLITMLVIFSSFWLTLYVARTIADPVRQLAEATERIKAGDLSYRTDVIGDDELAALALSFNEMTAELAENRRRLEQSADDLQQSNASLDERRRYIEAVLQSLSAGVISLDENANVTTINEAAMKLLRIDSRQMTGVALEGLLSEEHREDLRKMILRAARLRSVTREVHFTLAEDIKLVATVTVTALQNPSGQSRGAVIVIEDLTELIEAQRRAAWSEVARRMAHEIKNPLTPIKLSAERLAKNLLGEANGKAGRDALNERQAKIVRECTSMIGAEVATLQRMVDEFSNFARLPNARLETTSLNEVVENTLKLYDERLNGIGLESNLDAGLSPVLIDREQIKRVLVNLIDNAAEALAETSNGNGGKPYIKVSTREIPEREAVELVVADSGPGIAPEDRERVFDPYFSTRKRGTGLGLPIVSHIIAEHQGRIRLQDNSPRGTLFVIELPAAK